MNIMRAVDAEVVGINCKRGLSYGPSQPMGNVGEDYPHLITDGAVVDQIQYMLS